MKYNQIFLILILCNYLCIFQESGSYYGLKYAESEIDTDALDPVNGRRSSKQIRLGELINARLWRWGHNLQKESDLVESIPERPGIGDSRTDIQIRLKNNIRWPDGTPLTVEDIIFTFNVYRNCGVNHLQYAARRINCERIPGMMNRFYFKPSTLFNEDPSQKNFYHFLLLAIPKFQILPEHELVIPDIPLGSNYSLHPIGGGPFSINKIEKKGRKVSINLLRNSYHHFDQPPMMLKEVTMVTESILDQVYINLNYNDEESFTDGLHKGYDLLVEEVSNTTTINKLKVIDHLDSYSYVRNSWIGLGINTNKPILDSKEFRIILDELINDSEIINKNYGGAQNARDITGPFLQQFGIYKEGLLDRTDKIENIRSKLNSMDRFIDKGGKIYSIDLVTGKINPIAFTLIYLKTFAEEGSREYKALNTIKSEFSKIGIELNLRDLKDRNNFFNFLQYKKDKWDMVYMRNIFSWDNNISPILLSDSKYNYTGYDNKILDGLLIKYQQSPPGSERGRLGEEIHQFCYDNVPWIFLWNVKSRAYKRKILRNMKITPETFFTTISDWEIEPRE